MRLIAIHFCTALLYFFISCNWLLSHNYSFLSHNWDFISHLKTICDVFFSSHLYLFVFTFHRWHDLSFFFLLYVRVSVGGYSDYFHSSEAPVTKAMSKHSAECQILGAGVCAQW